MSRDRTAPAGTGRDNAPGDWYLKSKEGRLIEEPKYRVVMCHRWTMGAPGLWRSPAGDNAEYSDVFVCGSVWMCPLCAPKITSGRRDELIAAIGAWRDRGGEVYLATRTFSHDKHSLDLRALMAKLTQALARAKGARGARELAERTGVIGTIRSLEVTHGEINGWHPHTHELIFARPGEGGRLSSHRSAWIRELIKGGLAGMRDGMSRAERAAQLRHLRRHAYTVQLGDRAADYVAKFGMEPATDAGRWGPASELVRGHQKTGERLSGRTPFELLRLYTEEGDERAGWLFRDFALAFHGRAQLFWSKGLRASLVDLCNEQAEQFGYSAPDERRKWAARAAIIERDADDPALAMARAPECTEFVYRFSADEWRLLLRHDDGQAEALEAAMLEGAPGVRALLDELRSRPPWRGRGDDHYVADWRARDGRGRGSVQVFGPDWMFFDGKWERRV